jgi:hypothetical protein
VALGLSSSGSVSSHLPLVPVAESVALPSLDASVLLSSNSVGVGAGAGLTQPFFHFPSLSRAAKLGEKIRSSFPALQSTKPCQRYYRKARDLRKGHSVKWNEGLLADSLATSKTPICSAKNEVVAVPPVKNSAGSAKKGFLRNGFLNPCPAAIGPTASREANDVGMVWLHSPSRRHIIPSSVEGNGFSQSQEWLVGFDLNGELVVWEKDDDFWD